MENIQQTRTNDDEDRKLFIGGISWDTNENDIREYFGKFGDVDEVNIKVDAHTGHPRGFGFMTFFNEDAIEKVLAVNTHVIRGKMIDPKRAKTRPILKKIFVGGIDANMNEHQIKDYFTKFGRVEGIELPFDRVKQKRREFCFIIFDSEASADSACREPKQVVGGRECDIKKAQPQPVAIQQRRLQQQQQQQQQQHHGGNAYDQKKYYYNKQYYNSNDGFSMNGVASSNGTWNPSAHRAKRSNGYQTNGRVQDSTTFGGYNRYPMAYAQQTAYYN